MPPHSRRTRTTWDLTSPRRRLSCLWTLTDSSAQPHPVSGCMVSQKTYRIAQILLSTQRTSAASTASAVTVATAVLFQSNKHSVMCRHLRFSPALLTNPGRHHFRDLKSRTCCVLHTTSLPKQRPRAHLRRVVSVYLGRYTEFISASSRTAAPCQYHPSGTTLRPFQRSPEKERQYRPCENPTRHL